MKGLCNLATTALIGTPQLAVHVSCRALRNQGVSESSQVSHLTVGTGLLRCLCYHLFISLLTPSDLSASLTVYHDE